jgi:xanthine dehydrogenase accessory factor
VSFDRAALAALIARQGSVMRVVVAEVQGSAPREVGTSMVVWGGGQEGTIGGGALEFEAVRHARNLTVDRIERIALGPARGQCCGGAVTLLSERWDAARLEHTTGDLVARGPGEMPLAVRRVLARARGGAAVAPQFVQGWMVEPLAPDAQPLWIYGAGHVGRALVSVLAPLPRFSITWVDTAADRFPVVPEELTAGVTQLVAANPADVVHHAPADAQHLILTYSHALDLDLCHRLLLHGFDSAGLIGSATKWARFRSRLRALGHADAQIARICCPIGQPALGKHPQAIAIGVAAKLISGETALLAARNTA